MNESLSKLGFEKVGHFQLVGEGSKLVREGECGSGVYAMTSNGDVKYVGETERGFKRFRGYEKPSPERYKARLVPEKLKRGNAVELWFLSSEKYSNWSIVLNNEVAVMPDRLLVEQCLITLFLPEWSKELRRRRRRKETDH